MKTWRKEISLLLVGLMIMSGLVAFSAPAVTAHTRLTGGAGRFTVLFNDPTMMSELVYEVDPIDNDYYLLGEGDGVRDYQAFDNTVRVGVQLTNNWPPVTQATLNITSYQATVFDFNDPDHETHSPVQGGAFAVIPAVNTTGFANFTFMFDVLRTSVLGSDANTQVSMRLWFSGGGSGSSGENIDFNINIYLSSLFDDPATEAHEHIPDILDNNAAAGEDVLFEAGDMFEPALIRLTNYGQSDIDDLVCTVTPPANSGITLRENRAWLPNGINPAGTGDATFRVDVASRTLPGVYHGTAAITYTRDDSGLAITEPATQVVDFRVNYNFYSTNPYPAADTESMDQCYASSVRMIEEVEGNTTRQEFPDYSLVQTDQSTFSDKMISFQVNITNNGNADLQRVTYMLNITNPAWDYFRNPKIYYDEASGPATLNDDISIMFDTHNIGQVRSFNITVIVVKEIPIGEHRLPIIYDGYFFDNGSLGMATNMTEVLGGDGLPGTNVMNDDLELSFSIWINDANMDCRVTVVTAANADKQDIRSETISVTIQNLEGYSFIDIRVTADFTGTPFYAPLIDTTTGQPPLPAARNHMVEAYNANPSNPMAGWSAYDPTNSSSGVMVVNFRVDTDSTMPPDRYPFTLMIVAIIENTLEEVTTTISSGAEFDFTGYGPEIFITAFAGDEEIVPGQAFTLTMTLQNSGDDSLRDVWVEVGADDTVEYDWTLESSFKEQFDWTEVFSEWGDSGNGGGVAWTDSEFPSEMFYTVESLDVDNIREIVEINLYMDGVYSDPGARITVVHIMDLAPGASTDVVFDMFADKDMVNGKPYSFNVTISGLTPDASSMTSRTVFHRTIQVQSSLPGDSYNPVELNWFDAGLKALALFLFFIIVLAILLFVYNMFKGEPYDDDEEDFDFEDDEPFEPAPAAHPAKKEVPEELVEP
jgi:cbb3-type cytochrome oxidase subunit 3